MREFNKKLLVINIKNYEHDKYQKNFFSVGQGCFYAEKIYFEKKTITIVYDCGSLNKERLKKEIQQSGLEKIDFLIISHFHKDHINGIDELKNNCEIKNVIIPKLDALDIVFYLGTENTIEHLLLNPRSYFEPNNQSEPPNIITINPNVDDRSLEGPIDRLPNHISHNHNIPIITDAGNKLWVLRFYVDKKVFKNNKLSPKQRETIDRISNITDFESKKEELKEAYDVLSRKKINLTSMSMVSAPVQDLYYHFYHYKRYPISILNGDVLLDNEMRIRDYTHHFNDFKHFGFHFHIPHHGSHKNLLRPINEWQIKKGIILSGYNNQYGHPSGIVLRKFKDSNITTKALTEFDRNYSKEYSLFF